MTSDLSSLLLLIVMMAQRGSVQAQTQCMVKEPEDKKMCIINRGLRLTAMPDDTLDVLMPNYESLETFFTLMDPDLICDNLPKYKEAMRCTLNVTRDCFDPTGLDRITADPDDAVAGMDEICRLRDQMNMPCLKRFFNTVLDCSRHFFDQLGISFMFATNKEMYCSSSELMYDCTEVIIKPLCGENTTNIVMEQVGTFQLQMLCKNGSEPHLPRERHFEVLRTPEPQAQKNVGEFDNSGSQIVSPSRHVIAISGAAAAIVVALNRVAQFFG